MNMIGVFVGLCVTVQLCLLVDRCGVFVGFGV